MQTSRVYLDYAAASPLDPRVGAAMAACAMLPGNPSSSHAEGRVLRVAIDDARGKLAALLGAAPATVTFTSGATEANALALLGAWRQLRLARKGDAAAAGGTPWRVLTTPIEHASVRAQCAALAADGAILDTVPVGKDGLVTAQDVAAAVMPNTVLVSVMWANNVLGTVQPIAEIGAVVAAERARRAGEARAAGTAPLPIIFHCDAAQALSTQPVLPVAAGVDLLTVSAQKMYGPKGAGALVNVGRVPLLPLYGGGGHEGGLRHGTENVPAIVGFGEAAAILSAARAADAARSAALKQRLLEGLRQVLPAVETVGDQAQALPGTLFIRVPRVPGDRLALLLDAAGIAVSAGSACDAGTKKAPAALSAALGAGAAAHGGVRISFGRFTADGDIQTLLAALAVAAR